MKGWHNLTQAALADLEKEEEIFGEAELVRDSSSEESDPSVIPLSSQTSDESWLKLRPLFFSCNCPRILSSEV